VTTLRGIALKIAPLSRVVSYSSSANNEITDTGLEYIAKGCKHLKTANLQECGTIAGIATIIESCPDLTLVRMRGQGLPKDLENINPNCTIIWSWDDNY
jgi:hypothetical protein